jgi:hypothetical protein
MPRIDSFQFLASGALEHQKGPGVQAGNRRQAAIQREFQAVGAFGLQAECPDYALFEEVDAVGPDVQNSRCRGICSEPAGGAGGARLPAREALAIERNGSAHFSPPV